jgi:hypothetical protein
MQEKRLFAQNAEFNLGQARESFSLAKVLFSRWGGLYESPFRQYIAGRLLVHKFLKNHYRRKFICKSWTHFLN